MLIIEKGIAMPIRVLVLIVLVNLFLTGCSTLRSWSHVFDSNELDNIVVEANVDSNLNNPVALDIVFVYDEKLKTTFAPLNGPQWFDKKAGLVFRYKADIDVVNLEVVPLTATKSITLPDRHNDAIRVLMFANYIDQKGQYVADLTVFKQVTITLKRDQYELNEMSK